MIKQSCIFDLKLSITLKKYKKIDTKNFSIVEFCEVNNIYFPAPVYFSSVFVSSVQTFFCCCYLGESDAALKW